MRINDKLIHVPKIVALLLVLSFLIYSFFQRSSTTYAANGQEYVHNFTVDGLSSNFYSIHGNLSTSKGTVTYNGLTLTQCLKIETSTNISFTISEPAELTLVFHASNSSDIKIDGATKTYTNGILTINLLAGSHTITKASVANLFYIKLSQEDSSAPTATPTASPDPTSTPTIVPTLTPTIAPTATPTNVPTPTPVIIGDAIYVSPNGSGDGSLNTPTSIDTAIQVVHAGQTIYLLEGIYSFNEQLTIPYGNNGTSNAYKTIMPYNNAKVTFDFSSQAYGDTASNPRGIQLEGNFWHIYGIKVYGSADNGIFVCGNDNIIEYCELVANRDTGLQISRRKSSLSNFSEWPANNLIKNCTSYNNMDPATGENADGFAAKLTCGNGNVFDGCIAYNNVDDGWDLYAKSATGPIGSVTIKNCIAFRNGATSEGVFTSNSDGNGFKLGGSGIAVSHYVENCIAFENKNHGFTDNSNPGVITLKNCTSFNNSLEDGGKSNFDFARSTSSNNVFIQLISFSTSKVSSDKYKGTATNCSFYNGGNYYLITSTKSVDTKSSGGYKGELNPAGVTSSDFKSLSTPGLGADVHTLWRNSDGSINIGNLLAISSQSQYQGFGASF